MIRRWWRWATNPNPCVGQIWRLDGIGAVEVQDVMVDVGGFEVDDPRHAIAITVFRWWGVQFKTRAGHEYLWGLSSFRAHGEPLSADAPRLLEDGAPWE